ncbi:hypothetical protein CAL12_20330 [Bordetella genomosp. 8]|uniref:Glutaredoxin domain-containing protein n=1 Tax=Bordetella genomosp. 8 TaxID=1416806 RepID=A0A1W6YPB2_9BORD|nr:hypothetical protein [Bordetella genomosp. 8]ARP82930.1 hypothetical protein CAL12_20330 [Bordetella genomosp. 8]
MHIALYTTAACDECDKTKAALVARGIRFTERSAAEHQCALVAKGFDGPPVIAFSVESELVAWQGYRQDLIDLLADLIEYGPLPRHGFRDLCDARDAVLTRFQAMQHIRGHQLDADEFFADHGKHPLYRGAVLLDWLGY